MPETLVLLQTWGAVWLENDEPRFKDSVKLVEGVTTQPFRYLRMHGRNAAAWWKGDREARYDYLYTVDELRPIVSSVARARAARVAFNNNPNAHAISNARDFIAMLRDVPTADVVVGARPPR